MKIIITAALAVMLALSTVSIALAGNGSAPGHAEAQGTVQGTAEDPNAPALGEIDYLFNPDGYHLWFTAVADLAPNYVAGHSYHNIYKYSVDDPANYCGTTVIPDRMPYNAGDTVGATVHYKIWNVTTESWVCGSDGE